MEVSVWISGFSEFLLPCSNHWKGTNDIALTVSPSNLEFLLLKYHSVLRNQGSLEDDWFKKSTRWAWNFIARKKASAQRLMRTWQKWHKNSLKWFLVAEFVHFEKKNIVDYNTSNKRYLHVCLYQYQKWEVMREKKLLFKEEGQLMNTEKWSN